VTFVSLNDIGFVASESEADAMILGLASGDIVEERLTRWMRGNWPEGA
jgi:death-on-curing protein